MSGPPLVHIHYRRPPDREEVFRQHLIDDRPDVKVTLAHRMSVERPLRIEGRTALEDGSDVVWFTFPGRWHDIGRFHRADGTFTGIYANVLTPPELDLARDAAAEGSPEGAPEGPTAGDSVADRIWRTTDLYLDLWIAPDGRLSVLDRDQLAEAVDRGWIEPDVAERAGSEAERLARRHGEGLWPPPVVEEWTRERALEVMRGAHPR